MCDSMIASSLVTKYGYSVFGKNSDRSPNEPQPMVFCPAADHAKGSKVKCTLIEVEQAEHTNAVILSKPSWIWGGEMGINEFGVCIGNEAVISRDLDKNAQALLGMDILRIALERADTAKKAVEVIGEMMEKYGQGGNCSFDGSFFYDNAYLVSDGKQIWHVETAGQHYWCAKLVKEPAYSISNYLSLNTPDVMHPNLIDHAKAMGYPVEEPFNFQRTYAFWDGLGMSGKLRRCCSFQQMNRPGSAFDVNDMMTALRTHDCNDEWTEGMHTVCMHARNPEYPTDIDCQSTNSMIAVLKGEKSLILAPGMSTPCIAPFQPFWFDAYSKEQVFDYSKLAEANASWCTREGINRAIIDGRIPVDTYRAEMHEMEQRWLNKAFELEGADSATRQAFVDANAKEADAFIAKWLEYAEKQPSDARGDEGFKAWWAVKNENLGKDKRIAE